MLPASHTTPESLREERGREGGGIEREGEMEREKGREKSIGIRGGLKDYIVF